MRALSAAILALSLLTTLAGTLLLLTACGGGDPEPTVDPPHCHEHPERCK